MLRLAPGEAAIISRRTGHDQGRAAAMMNELLSRAPSPPVGATSR